MEQGHKANSYFNVVVMSDVVVFAVCVCLFCLEKILWLLLFYYLFPDFFKKNTYYVPDPLPNVLFIKYFFFLFFVHSFILIINHHNNSFSTEIRICILS